MNKADKTEYRYNLYALALAQAHTAAAKAQEGLIEDTESFNCGFAWVVVHDLAFMRWCRIMRKQIIQAKTRGEEGVLDDRLYGDKHYATGWCFWKPGSFNGQQIDIHLKGAVAFVDSLSRSLGIRCETGSRLD